MEKSERKLKLPLLIGAIPFLLAGIDGITQGKVFFGVVNLLMAGANLIGFKIVGKAPMMTNAVLHLANAAVACVVSYDYFLQGKKGLPYAWIVAAVAFSVAAAFFYRKATAPKTQS